MYAVYHAGYIKIIGGFAKRSEARRWIAENRNAPGWYGMEFGVDADRENADPDYDSEDRGCQRVASLIQG